VKNTAKDSEAQLLFSNAKESIMSLSTRTLMVVAALAGSLFLGTSTTQAQFGISAYVDSDHFHEDEGYQPKLGFRGRVDCDGLKILSVGGNSLAWKLGLEAGDVITHVNGIEVKSHQQYLSILRHATTHHDGRVKLRIENIRWHTGESNQRFLCREVQFRSPTHGCYCDNDGRVRNF
jgi:S1-C subfamily serine protease